MAVEFQDIVLRCIPPGAVVRMVLLYDIVDRVGAVVNGLSPIEQLQNWLDADDFD